jgi:hypothetical protein
MEFGHSSVTDHGLQASLAPDQPQGVATASRKVVIVVSKLNVGHRIRCQLGYFRGSCP